MPYGIRCRDVTTTETLNGDETMEDLNNDSRCFGWNQIAFWMKSVHYWTDQLSRHGDDNGQAIAYVDSIRFAWKMVDAELFGV
jgi:hypothetical protein